MSQATYIVPSNQTGTNFRTKMNAALAAIVTSHKGSTAPSYAAAGIIWCDDSASPIYNFKIFDGTDWISMGTLSTSTNQWTPANAALTSGSNLYITDTGTVNVLVAALVPALTALTPGLTVRIKIANALTGSSTLNVNGLGAVAVKKNATTDTSPGDLQAGEIAVFTYDGTFWQIVSSVFQVPATINDVKAGTINYRVVTPLALAGLWAKGADIPSAATLTIPATGGGFFVVTGTTTITAITEASTGAGRTVRFRFSAAMTLTHNSTSLILPGGANILTAIGDMAEFSTEGGGNWRCVSYQKANGQAVISPSLTPIRVILQDQKTTGTSGGTSTGAAWNTRVLNTIALDTNGICTLSGNQFTLPAGSYYIRARCPGQGDNGHKCRLFNITTSSTMLVGSSTRDSSANTVQTDTIMVGFITIGVTTTFELQHYFQSGLATQGLGLAGGSGNGEVEIYASIEIIKDA